MAPNAGVQPRPREAGTSAGTPCWTTFVSREKLQNIGLSEISRSTVRVNEKTVSGSAPDQPKEYRFVRANQYRQAAVRLLLSERSQLHRLPVDANYFGFGL